MSVFSKRTNSISDSVLTVSCSQNWLIKRIPVVHVAEEGSFEGVRESVALRRIGNGRNRRRPGKENERSRLL
jgi:hypothetical protein